MVHKRAASMVAMTRHVPTKKNWPIRGRFRCSSLFSTPLAMKKVLFLTTSSSASSVSSKLGERLVGRFRNAVVTRRDLGKNPPPIIDAEWVSSRAVPTEQQTPEQRAKMQVSDELVSELKAADVVVLSVAVYNFTIPASLKAWIDLIARPGVTFRYTASGPQGLLPNTKCYIVSASGGTPFGSSLDFYSEYLKSVLKFVGSEAVLVASSTGVPGAGMSFEQACAAVDAAPLDPDTAN